MDKKYSIGLIIILLGATLIFFCTIKNSNRELTNENMVNINIVKEDDSEQYTIVDKETGMKLLETSGEDSAEIFNYDENFNPNQNGEDMIETNDDIEH